MSVNLKGVNYQTRCRLRVEVEQAVSWVPDPQLYQYIEREKVYDMRLASEKQIAVLQRKVERYKKTIITLSEALADRSRKK